MPPPLNKHSLQSHHQCAINPQYEVIRKTDGIIGITRDSYTELAMEKIRNQLASASYP